MRFREYDMHLYIAEWLDRREENMQPLTCEMTWLLILGIHNSSWVGDVSWHVKPEGGVKFVTGARDIDDEHGYLDLYVHEDYAEFYIRPARRNGLGGLNRVVMDGRFNWELLNTYLQKVDELGSRPCI